VAKWKAITVDVPRPNVFIAAVRTGLKGVVEDPKKDFESFVRTWRKSPKIIVKVEKKADELSAFTGVESDWSSGKAATPEDIFMFLTRGTSVRYATMSSNFKAKTRRGVISSGSGGGDRDPFFIGDTNPGIEAREVEEAVRNKNEKKVLKQMETLMETAARASQLV
jgi:hypothetical protein